MVITDTRSSSFNPNLAALSAAYPGSDAGYDELLGSDGIRPHWAPLMRELDALGAPELRHRSETARRIVREQGITYNVYGDPLGVERPWELDPLPFVIPAQEWAALEKGLIQRATLINKILADCYGPQELIRSRWLPPALLFAQADYLRPAHGIRSPNGTLLHCYAADLARSPDGQWWVLSDRTQIPTGAGYALANRLVTSRVLPGPFRDCRVQRIAGFFRQLQATLAGLAARRTEEPRVVMLTPGPYNETYFEQAYLARYLGYSLVEGQDLTVRDDRVYLKTLSGLEPVDVLLRRVDDDFCDPLELRGDSMLGVPGLVEAVRAGNVAVANALGSGLLQSPAFMAFLPGLARHILGEELQLPSVATWWCGQKSAEEATLARLDSLDVRPAFHLRHPQSLVSLSSEEKRARIRFEPHLWVAQERMQFSKTPAWTGTGLTASPVVVRAYLVSTPDGYAVMPGGLTRITTEAGARLISMQQGGASKDTWVLSEKPVEEITLLTSSGTSVELRRVGNNLPSRLADNFYWLGRYTERADATARLLRSALVRFNPENSARSLLTPLLRTLATKGQLSAEEAEQSPEALEAELLAAVFDPKRPSSLRRIADRVQLLAMQVRDRTSNDVWRALGQLDECLTPSTSGRPVLTSDAIGILNRLLLLTAAFYGFARENMTRAQGWRFLDMGQRIERAIYLCVFLEHALHQPEADNPSVLEVVLEVADSALTYRSRYNLMPNIAAAYDLVLLDDTNPRSLLFQFLQLVKHFDHLPRERHGALPSPGQRVLIECVARLRLLDPRELDTRNSAWHEGATGQVLRDTLRDLPRLSEAIAVNYFAHSTISRA